MNLQMKPLLLLLCGLMALPLEAGLNTGEPGAWSEISPDQSRILVVLPPYPAADEPEELEITLPDGRRVNLRETFLVSGVFDVDSLELRWTLNWGFLKWRMVWNNDFSSIFVWHRKNFVFKKGQPIGLNFLKDGVVQKFYAEADLLTRFSKWYFLPQGSYGIGYDLHRQGDQVIFTTPRRGSPSPVGWRDIGFWEVYTFDLHTGEILSLEIEDRKTRVIITWLLIGFGGVFSLIIALLIWLAKRSQSKNRA